MGSRQEGKEGVRRDTDPKILCTKDPGLSERVLAIEEDAELMSVDSRKHVFLFFLMEGMSV